MVKRHGAMKGSLHLAFNQLSAEAAGLALRHDLTFSCHTSSNWVGPLPEVAQPR